MSLHIDPTGSRLVTGSYDKTVRLFNLNEGRSYDVYHNRRMQRVECVGFTLDSKYVLSASQDTNIRLWKSVSYEKIGKMNKSQSNSINYNNELIKRFKHLPELKQIDSRRLVPNEIKKLKKLKHEINHCRQRKEENRRKHIKIELSKNYQSKRKQTVRLIEE